MKLRAILISSWNWCYGKLKQHKGVAGVAMLFLMACIFRKNLNENAGAITAIATAVLAVITYIYMRYAKDVVRLEREKIEAERPTVEISASRNAFTISSISSSHMDICVELENVGAQAATELCLSEFFLKGTRSEIWWEEDGALQGPAQILPLSALGLGKMISRVVGLPYDELNLEPPINGTIDNVDSMDKERTQALKRLYQTLRFQATYYSPDKKRKFVAHYCEANDPKCKHDEITQQGDS